MAQLLFEVKNQHINRVDTFKPVAKSKNYLYAHFDFLTDDWKSKTVTAIFESSLLEKPIEMLLDSNYECLVPWEVLAESGDVFVSVFALDLITTDSARIHVYETLYSEDLESSREPTPDIYTQMVNEIDRLKGNISELEYKVANMDGGLFTDWKQEG